MLSLCCPAGVWQDQAVPAKTGWPGGALKRGKWLLAGFIYNLQILWQEYTTCTVCLQQPWAAKAAHVSSRHGFVQSAEHAIITPGFNMAWHMRARLQYMRRARLKQQQAQHVYIVLCVTRWLLCTCLWLHGMETRKAEQNQQQAQHANIVS
jgi:hypothetical protein